MTKNLSKLEVFSKGILKDNPVLVQLLGLCPTLAVTNSLINGIAMGLATTFVLISSSLMVSLVRNLIPKQVRIASYIIIIATFVTVADIFLKANFYEISKALGPFVPLIVVNCIILGRAEGFASKNTPLLAFYDALGMGIGFIIGLVIISAIREILGSGTLLGISILGPSFKPWLVMVLPPGAFFTMGGIIALMNTFKRRS